MDNTRNITKIKEQFRAGVDSARAEVWPPHAVTSCCQQLPSRLFYNRDHYKFEILFKNQIVQKGSCSKLEVSVYWEK